MFGVAAVLLLLLTVQDLYVGFIKIPVYIRFQEQRHKVYLTNVHLLDRLKQNREILFSSQVHTTVDALYLTLVFMLETV